MATVPVLADSLFKVRVGAAQLARRGAVCGVGMLGLLRHRLSQRGWHTAQLPRAQRAAPLGTPCFLPVCSLVTCPCARTQVWIFLGLNKADPAAAVTLRQMDRH